jgi:hypothetical protein
MRLSVVLTLIILAVVGVFIGQVGAAIIAFLCALFFNWAFKKIDTLPHDFHDDEHWHWTQHKDES